MTRTIPPPDDPQAIRDLIDWLKTFLEPLTPEQMLDLVREVFRLLEADENPEEVLGISRNQALAFYRFVRDFKELPHEREHRKAELADDARRRGAGGDGGDPSLHEPCDTECSAAL